jgi:hypothetical protein
MNCHDRISGERFEADSLEEIEAYLREALSEGESVAYDVETDTGEHYRGEITA